MVRIRLARRGQRNRPFYHIVVTDSENARDGKYIERLGTYDPQKPDTEATIDAQRWSYWTKQGALPSERVGKLVERKLATVVNSVE